MKATRKGQRSTFVHVLSFVLGGTLSVAAFGCTANESGGEFDENGDSCTDGTCAVNRSENAEKQAKLPQDGISAPSPADILIPKAANCEENSECPSGFCVDGVCCNSACDGECEACTASKKGGGLDGICGPIAYDTDPDEECWGGACTGDGACKLFNGVACTDTSECLSNYCVDGFCCGNICTQGCFACSNAKKGYGYDGVCEPIASGRDPNRECPIGESCDGAGQCSLVVGVGEACRSNAACASGFCVDGVCCASACDGACEACSLAKKGRGADGICGLIAYDSDPDDECADGACNGSGECKSFNGVPCNSTTDCLSNYCADGVCCGNLCEDLCVACTAAKKGYGFDGVCEPVAFARDPDQECWPGTCNGGGMCTLSAAR